MLRAHPVSGEPRGRQGWSGSDALPDRPVKDSQFQIPGKQILQDTKLVYGG